MLAVVVVTVVVMTIVIEVSGVVVGRARAAGAADLAALAAATAMQDPDGPPPAAAAGRVARANDVDLVDCACARLPLTVTVAAVARSPLGLVPDRRIEASARATLVPQNRHR